MNASSASEEILAEARLHFVAAGGGRFACPVLTLIPVTPTPVTHNSRASQTYLGKALEATQMRA